MHVCSKGAWYQCVTLPALPHCCLCRRRPLLPLRPVRSKLRKASGLARTLFNAAYHYKLFLLRQGVPFG